MSAAGAAFGRAKSVEFVPAGAAEPVLAVDLIDEGSVPSLEVGAPATVAYEEAAPRTARIEGGTRQFAARNLNGAILGVGLLAAAFLGMFAALEFAGRAMSWTFRRILQRR